jgi:hypothetical protein
MLVSGMVGAASAVFVVGALVGCPPQPKPPVDADAEPSMVVVALDAARGDLTLPVIVAPKDAEAVSDARMDAPRASACSRACAKLKAVGCPEAEQIDGGLACVDLCDKAEASGKFTLKPECVAAAASVEAVRACGSVRCAK